MRSVNEQPKPSNLDSHLALSATALLTAVAVYLYLVNFGVVYLIVVLFALASCISWLVIRRRELQGSSLGYGNRGFLIAGFVFFLSQLVSIISFVGRQNEYERPTLYFLAICAMVSAVTLQILSIRKAGSRLRTIVVLGQIVAIGLNLEWSEQVLFPSLVGYDPAWHYMFVSRILETGHVPAGLGYSAFPLFHIDVLTAIQVAALDYKSAISLSISSVQIISDCMFAYLIGRLLFRDLKFGLFAALFLIVADRHIQFGFWGIPNTFAAIFLLIIVYYVLKNIRSEHPTYLVLLLMFMLSIILSHTVTALCALLVAAIIFATSRIVEEKRSRDATQRSHTMAFPAIFFISLFIWWIQAANPIRTIGEMIRSRFTIDVFYRGPEYGNYLASVPIAEQLFDNLGFILFFSISLLGCFYVITKRNPPMISLMVAGLFLLSIGFVAPILEKEVLTVRWWYFAQMLMSLPLSVSVLVIAAKIKRRNMATFGVIIFAFLLTFLMITSPSANIDNAIFSPDTVNRSAFTHSELDGAAYLADHYHGNFSSDFDYCTNPSSSVFINFLGVERSRIVSLDQMLYYGSFEPNGTMKIIRIAIENSPFRLSGGLYKLNYDPDTLLSSNSQFDRVYDTRSVTAYV